MNQEIFHVTIFAMTKQWTFDFVDNQISWKYHSDSETFENILSIMQKLHFNDIRLFEYQTNTR